MLKSDTNKVLYLMPQKTASTSAGKTLLGVSDWHNFHHKHWRFSDVEVPGWDDSWLGFLVLRNPWARTVSAYEYHLREWAQRKHPRRLMNSAYRRFIKDHDESFESWVKGFCPLEIEQHTGRILSFSYPLMSWFDPMPVHQQRWVRLEDFPQAWDDLGPVLLRHCSEKMPPLSQHNRAPQNRPYQEYYTKETRDLVAEWFERDINAGGYTFE